MRATPLALAVAVLLALASLTTGCSAGPDMPGAGGPAPAESVSVPPEATGGSAAGPAPIGSADPSPSVLLGLTESCSSVLNLQVAISDLLAKPVDGHLLTAADVAAVFAHPDVPGSLTPAVDTLHSAATDSIGKTDVQAAAIISAAPVTDALNALTAYVQRCTPTSS